MNKRLYEKIKINLEDFKSDAESGNFTPKELAEKYNLLRNNKVRRIYYLGKKHNISFNLKRDYSHITDEWKSTISDKLTGIKRTSDQLNNYKKSAQLRGNNRPIGSYNHSEDVKNKIRESNVRTYEKLPSNWSSSCINNPEWFKKLRKIDYDKLDDWEKYCYNVRRLSYKNAKKYKDLIEGEKGKGYHLDHILSISEAFNNDLDIDIVSSHYNLRYIKAEENLKKSYKSEISINELKQKYYGK
jgi:hypothetical protein